MWTGQRGTRRWLCAGCELEKSYRIKKVLLAHQAETGHIGGMRGAKQWD